MMTLASTRVFFYKGRIKQHQVAHSDRKCVTGMSSTQMVQMQHLIIRYLVSWAKLVDGKDLSWVESLAENIDSSQLATKHSVCIRCF